MHPSGESLLYDDDESFLEFYCPKSRAFNQKHDAMLIISLPSKQTKNSITGITAVALASGSDQAGWAKHRGCHELSEGSHQCNVIFYKKLRMFYP